MYLLIILFVLGLFIGSFLGVVIDRLPRKKSIIIDRSECNNCHHSLGIFDLIPVLSFALLKGKCRYCKHKLSIFYPVIEIITGLLFTITFITLTTPLTIFNFQFIFYLIFILLILSSFIIIFFIDFKHKIIPDSILVFDTLITIVWLVFNQQALIINHVLSAIGSFSFFYLISLIFYLVVKKMGMGGGDIKLAFVMGLFLGFPGIFMAIYIAFIAGGLVALPLLIFKRKKLSSALPFGPFLIIGTLISLFFQNNIYNFILKLSGF